MTASVLHCGAGLSPSDGDRPSDPTVRAAPEQRPLPSRPALPIDSPADDQGRLRDLLDTQFRFVWRLIRRLGVEEAMVDDAAQQVFIIAAQKLISIEAGRERAFLASTATRVAANARRLRQRRPEVPEGPDSDAVPCSLPNAEQLVELRQRRAMLDEVLDTMSVDLRAAFVLFELEQLTMVEIADVTKVPLGTVASRLRRARVQFERACTRLQRAGTLGEGR